MKFFLASVPALIPAAFAAGMAILFQEEFRSAAARLKMKNRLAARRLKETSGPGLGGKLALLAEIAGKDKRKGKTLLLLCGLPAPLTAAAGLTLLPLWKTAALTLAAALLPFLMLRAGANALRRRSSEEGEALVANLLNQYRIHRFNLCEALEGVLAESSETKVSNRFLFPLLIQLRETGNPVIIQKACRRFADSTGTGWGRMLAYNIGLAAERGINVSAGLEDLLIQLREARVLAEERKRLNGETVRIVTFLVPVLYGTTVLISVSVLDMTPASFFRNQFCSPQGFPLFLCIAAMMLINLLILDAVGNQRFDF